MLTVTKSVWGWRFMAAGAIACLLLTAVAAINSGNALWAVLLALVTFVACVAIYELGAVVQATNRPFKIAIAGAGLLACFIVLMAATDATVTGKFNLLPGRWSWWALPIAVVVWTLIEIWKRRRSTSK